MASTSRMRGMLRSTTSSRVSSDAASTGSAAFLFPAGTTVPSRGAPPSMMNFSIRGSVRGKRSSKGRARVSKAIWSEVRDAGWIPCPLQWPSRPATKPGSSCASGPSPTRCASTCSGLRRRCAPTRANGGRTRSSGVPPDSCTTSTTSATRTSEPGTRARRSRCLRSAATRAS
jgi:hypothetical protein